MPFNHTPILLPLMSLVSDENYEASYKRWSLLLIIVLLLALVPAYCLSKNADSSLQSILFLPIFISITQGQDTIFLLFAIFAWACLLARQQDFLAGLALAIGVVKPQIILLLGLPLSFSRFRAFVGFATGSTIAAVFGLLLVGFSGYESLIGIIRVSAAGGAFGVHQQDMYNLGGTFVRDGLSFYWIWVFFGIAIVGISILWRRVGITSNTLSLGIVATILATPHLLLHDLSLLVVPLYLIHPYAPAIATVALLISGSAGIPYLGADLIIAFAALYHLLRMKAQLVNGVPSTKHTEDAATELNI